ncbi:GNAT family N-acetyltransferase [Salimicrobium jeotgali]|uniref:GNAT family N-acetyltransferase n=1 Tax=Salimicrobium jeotgali TaxID=1230341 RepID=A0AAC8T5A1_9BACI|nr:GNAT family N-acetyltransferase [Salimicrobium jeotgali]AKG03525.1 GNAT family N-acetyltransferase [Salimicrobium jeotgali]MBM7695979.1 ribosomal protein S18 acetylase RimI-like enzyme [Salimicrobium jeotgali]
MEIRLLQPDDANMYWDLRLEALRNNPEAFATSYEEAMSKEDPVREVSKRLADSDSFTFGAIWDEEIVGMMTLVVQDTSKLRHVAHLIGVYVSPVVRNKGVGGQLLQKTIEKAKEEGYIEKINLSVVTNNDSAIRLYANAGFETWGVEKNALKMHREYYDEQHMTLEI